MTKTQRAVPQQEQPAKARPSRYARGIAGGTIQSRQVAQAVAAPRSKRRTDGGAAAQPPVLSDEIAPVHRMPRTRPGAAKRPREPGGERRTRGSSDLISKEHEEGGCGLVRQRVGDVAEAVSELGQGGDLRRPAADLH